MEHRSSSLHLACLLYCLMHSQRNCLHRCFESFLRGNTVTGIQYFCQVPHCVTTFEWLDPAMSVDDCRAWHITHELEPSAPPGTTHGAESNAVNILSFN